MRRVVVTGMGMVTPVGRDLEIDLVVAPGGPERRRADHAVRRRDLPDPDRRRGRRTSDLGRLHRRRRPLGRALPEHPVRHRRRRGWRWTIRAWRRCRTSTAPGSASTSVGRGAAGLPPVRRPGPPDVAARRAQVDTAEFTRHGRQGAPPDPRGRAGAGDARRATSPASSGAGAERQLPDRLRRQLAGDRRGGRDHPPRRRRRDALGRHAQHDPPVRRDRLQPPDRPLDPQRRARRAPAARSTATATASSWAKGRGCSSWRSSSTPEPRATHPRRDRRLRLDRRRLPDHRQPRRRPRRDRLHARGPGRRPAQPRGRRLHQRPRHQHRRQRLDRDPGDQADVRRGGLHGADLQHQEHDGPPDRRRRAASRRSFAC